MAQYEDEVTQMLALSVIPVEELKQKSQLDGQLSDALLAKHLMAWFHDHFFSWVDQPACESCAKPTRSIGECF